MVIVAVRQPADTRPEASPPLLARAGPAARTSPRLGIEVASTKATVACWYSRRAGRQPGQAPAHPVCGCVDRARGYRRPSGRQSCGRQAAPGVRGPCWAPHWARWTRRIPSAQPPPSARPARDPGYGVVCVSWSPGEPARTDGRGHAACRQLHRPYQVHHLSFGALTPDLSPAHPAAGTSIRREHETGSVPPTVIGAFLLLAAWARSCEPRQTPYQCSRRMRTSELIAGGRACISQRRVAGRARARSVRTVAVVWFATLSPDGGMASHCGAVTRIRASSAAAARNPGCMLLVGSRLSRCSFGHSWKRGSSRGPGAPSARNCRGPAATPQAGE